MKKLFLGLLLAVVVMSMNTSCKKNDNVITPSLSELRNFTFSRVSNALNFKYKGKDDLGYDVWDISLGKDFAGSGCVMKEVTYCDIFYEKGDKNKATFYYDIDFVYHDAALGRDMSAFAEGDLDLTFQSFTETMGFMDEYVGVETGIRDGLRVQDVTFTVANFTETKEE